ncbi:MAG: CBS domain-containing protein [Anaerolineales bacterium]
MLVGERMSKPVITVSPDTSIQEALNRMHANHIRRLPVLNNKGKLLGIITEQDLLHASPSDATSLSIWEMKFLLSKIQISEVMSKEVVTVNHDTPVEVAARIMADRKIGGLPVLQNGELTGIITETDLFRIFLEMLGAYNAGIRVTVLIPNIPGELSQITTAIHDAGGNIISLSTALGDSTATGEVIFKVEGIAAEELRGILEPLVDEIVDLREMGSG